MQNTRASIAYTCIKAKALTMTLHMQPTDRPLSKKPETKQAKQTKQTKAADTIEQDPTTPRYYVESAYHDIQKRLDKLNKELDKAKQHLDELSAEADALERARDMLAERRQRIDQGATVECSDCGRIFHPRGISRHRSVVHGIKPMPTLKTYDDLAKAMSRGKS